MKPLIAALSAIALLGCATAPAPQADVTTLLTSISEPRLLAGRVFAADLARSAHFYEAAFGLRVAQTIGNEMVLMFPDADRPGITISLNNPSAPRSNGGFIIGVPDIDATMARVTAAGGTITRPPPATGSRGFRIGIVADPDGTFIEVIQPAPAA